MVIIILLTEAYPANVQSIGTGFVESIGQLGSFLGPIIVNISIVLKIHPIIVISFIVVVLIVIPIIFMPETSSKHSILTISPEKVRGEGLRLTSHSHKED